MHTRLGLAKLVGVVNVVMGELLGLGRVTEEAVERLSLVEAHIDSIIRINIEFNIDLNERRVDSNYNSLMCRR